MATPFLVVNNLGYRFPKSNSWALRDVDLCIDSGELVVVVGPSGSGKSTLLRAIRGMLGDGGGTLSGSVLLSGTEVTTSSATQLGNKIAIVFQNPSYQLHQPRVIDEILSAPMYQGLPWSECIERAEDAVRGILDEELLRREPTQLSLGQQQRVAIAASLALKADLILFDEPFSYLDGHGTSDVVDLIQFLLKSGKTVIVATHEPDPLCSTMSRVVVLEKGQVRAQGLPSVVFYNEEVQHILAGPLYCRVGRSIQDKKQDSAILGWKDLWDRIPKLSLLPPGDVVAGNAVEVDPILQMLDVHYAYPNGVIAVNGTSLLIERGQVFGLVGRNGSGKTTLARLLLGLAQPQHGSILLNGEAISNRRLRGAVGYVTQNPSDMLFETTAMKECAFGPRAIGREDADARATAALRKLGLSELSQRDPRSLSGGEQRLLTIAAVVASDAEILILDEPEFGLDGISAGRVRSVLRTLRGEGRTLVLITHRVDLAFLLCHRVAFIDRGCVCAEGPPEKVLSLPSVIDTLAEHDKYFVRLWLRAFENTLVAQDEAAFIERLIALL